jgi:hypothetical protein
VAQLFSLGRLTLMPFPNQDYSKRDSLLPAGCKDLADAIKHEQASALPPVKLPPIFKCVSLPDMVAVKYLVEVTGASLYTITLDMGELGGGTSVDRSVDFELAAKILRKYGISAKRAA